MDSQELRRLRLGAGLTQEQAADHIGISYTRYCDMERGKRPISGIEGERAVSVLTCMQLPDDGEQADDRMAFALGEAVLMLTEEQRDELYARVKRDMVAEAAARVAMSKLTGTLVEELEKTKRDLRNAQDEISHIRSALSL